MYRTLKNIYFKCASSVNFLYTHQKRFWLTLTPYKIGKSKSSSAASSLCYEYIWALRSIFVAIDMLVVRFNIIIDMLYTHSCTTLAHILVNTYYLCHMRAYIRSAFIHAIAPPRYNQLYSRPFHACLIAFYICADIYYNIVLKSSWSRLSYVMYNMRLI